MSSFLFSLAAVLSLKILLALLPASPSSLKLHSHIVVYNVPYLSTRCYNLLKFFSLYVSLNYSVKCLILYLINSYSFLNCSLTENSLWGYMKGFSAINELLFLYVLKFNSKLSWDELGDPVYPFLLCIKWLILLEFPEYSKSILTGAKVLYLLFLLCMTFL